LPAARNSSSFITSTSTRPWSGSWAGLQKRKVVTEKEKRILAYHEGGHALMSHLVGDLIPVQKVTIVSRGQALGYTLNLPSEERYLHTTEEFQDLLKVYLAGRAAEQVVFGRVTNGAANDLEKVTELARAMVFEYGMSTAVTSRTMRADNYALSEENQASSRPGAGTPHRRGLRGRPAADHQAPGGPRPDRQRSAGEGNARSRGARRTARRCGGGFALQRDRGHGQGRLAA